MVEQVTPYRKQSSQHDHVGDVSIASMGFADTHSEAAAMMDPADIKMFEDGNESIMNDDRPGPLIL